MSETLSSSGFQVAGSGTGVPVAELTIARATAWPSADAFTMDDDQYAEIELPLDLFKMTVGEGGIRSPLIISGPHGITKGLQIDLFAYVWVCVCVCVCV